MTMQVFLNDAYLEEAAALISPLSPGFMYGYGVFETIRVSGKKALFLDQHYRRMVQALSVLGMTCPYQETELQPIIEKLLDLNGVSEGFVKVVCSKPTPKKQPQQEADILILTGTKTYKEEYATGSESVPGRCEKERILQTRRHQKHELHGKHPGKRSGRSERF